MDFEGEEKNNFVDWEKTAKYLQPLLNESGEVVGRIAGIMIGNQNHKSKSRFLNGSLVYKGAKIANEDFFGILEGVPSRASRDSGIPTCSAESLRAWFEGQADLVGNDNIGEANEIWLGQSLLKIGADSRRFAIARLGNELVSYSELEAKLTSFGEVKLMDEYSIEQISQVVGLKWVDPALLCVESSFGSYSPGLFKAGWMGEVQLPDALIPFSKTDISECSLIIKLACSFLKVDNSIIEHLTRMENFHKRITKKHVVTDKHDEKHELYVLHLTQGMNFAEFNAANPDMLDD